MLQYRGYLNYTFGSGYDICNLTGKLVDILRGHVGNTISNDSAEVVGTVKVAI